MLLIERNFMSENEVFKAKEFYRDRIIEMVNQINRTDILNYIYVVVSDIMKERGNKENV